jgi:hypothetical protein
VFLQDNMNKHCRHRTQFAGDMRVAGFSVEGQAFFVFDGIGQGGDGIGQIGPMD